MFLVLLLPINLLINFDFKISRKVSTNTTRFKKTNTEIYILRKIQTNTEIYIFKKNMEISITKSVT